MAGTREALRAARRQYRRIATNVTLAVSAVLYFLLIFSPEPQIASNEVSNDQLGVVVVTRHHHYLHYPLIKRNLLATEQKSQDHFLRATASHNFSSYSCEDMHKMSEVYGPLSRSAQCDFAQTCNDGDGIFCATVYCHPTVSSRTLIVLLSPPLVLFLIVLFRILGSTAEEFFSPGLEMLSLKLGLPERFAGVTLLALGNGAPDVASTVSAILNDRKRGYLMALGELTGAAMVASTVIVGAVAAVSDDGGVACRGSLIRDVTVFVLTMIVTYRAFDHNGHNDGTIGLGQVRCFILMYLAYVLIVLGSDVYHKVVVAPRMVSREKRVRRDKMGKQASDGAAPDGSLDVEIEPSSERTALVASGTNGTGVTEFVVPEEGIMELGHRDHLKGFRVLIVDPKPIANIERMIEAISNYDVESNDNTSDDDEAADHDELESVLKRTSLFRERSASVTTHPQSPKAPPRRHASDPHPSGWGERDIHGSEPLIVFHPHHGGIVNLKHAQSGSFDHHLHHHQRKDKTPPSPSSTVATDYHECEACLAGDPGPAPESWRNAFVASKDELTGLLRRLWGDTFASDEYNAVEKFLIACEMPFTVLRMASIPVPCDGYYCRPLVALSIALSPLWMWYYCWNQFDLNIVSGSAWSISLIFVFPLVIGLLVLRLAPCGEIPMRLSISVPITIVGFVVSAAWLDLIADKLVSILSFFGIILHIPSTIMGITILAWGNSSQDMIANMTVAKKGLSAMAMTASFAGPVFNILVGLGIGFSILIQTGNHGEPIPVSLNNPLRVGFLFAVLNGVLVIVSGTCIGKGTIPKKYGYAAIALYVVYAVVTLMI